MKKVNLLMMIFAVLFMTTNCAERIDAGHVGIRVDLYGEDKGVQEATEVTGMVWYNPWETSVYEVPTYVQSVQWEDEDEHFKVQTNNGMEVSFGIAASYRIPDSTVVKVFQKHRRNFDNLDEYLIRRIMKDVFTDVASLSFSATDMFERKSQFLSESEKRIRKELDKEGIFLENVGFTGAVKLPKSVIDNIEAKVNATQIALRKQDELAQTEADAKKKIVEAQTLLTETKSKADAEAYKRRVNAQAEAEAILAVARAQSEANRLTQASLTDELLQLKYIEKWNGVESKFNFGGGRKGGAQPMMLFNIPADELKDEEKGN